MEEFMPVTLLYLGQLLAVAGITEAAVQAIKVHVPFTLEKKHDQILALLVAMGIAVLSPLVKLDVDTNTLLTLKIVGGVLASRGSNLIHDLTNVVTGFATYAKNKGKTAETPKA